MGKKKGALSPKKKGEQSTKDADVEGKVSAISGKSEAQKKSKKKGRFKEKGNFLTLPRCAYLTSCEKAYFHQSLP